MTEKTHDQFQLERLAFFSDAVFAIAITLLIIEVRLPATTPETERGIAQGLADLIPQYIGFFVSFFVIGRFWIGHHRVFGRLKRVDDILVWRNLLFLMTIAFMPFPTALVSHYVSTRVAVGAYAGWLTLAGGVQPRGGAPRDEGAACRTGWARRSAPLRPGGLGPGRRRRARVRLRDGVAASRARPAARQPDHHRTVQSS